MRGEQQLGRWTQLFYALVRSREIKKVEGRKIRCCAIDPLHVSRWARYFSFTDKLLSLSLSLSPSSFLLTFVKTGHIYILALFFLLLGESLFRTINLAEFRKELDVLVKSFVRKILKNQHHIHFLSFKIYSALISRISNSITNSRSKDFPLELKFNRNYTCSFIAESAPQRKKRN